MANKSNKEIKAAVFDIQRFSVHDGPGIRTTVFLKGCPLRCKWCANPESQRQNPEILLRNTRCDQCGECVKACPLSAIVLEESNIRLDRDRCDCCMKCVDVCLTGAISRAGEIKTVEEIVIEAEKDKVFYNNSGGGVTISGGEPLFQPEFTYALLKALKEKSLHTALDTCGYAKWDVLDKILDYTDLALFDIKHIENEAHHAGTGFGNSLIFENLERTLEKNKKVWVRIPIIPGFNDSEKHVTELAEYFLKRPVEKITLLAYHELGRNKWEFLGLENPMPELPGLKEEELSHLRDIFVSAGLKATIGY